MKLMPSLRITTFGWIVTISLLFVVASTTALSIISIRNAEKMGETWTIFEKKSTQKELLLSQIRGLLGYDGMIHHFKNFILRNERKKVLIVFRKLLQLSIALTAYATFDLDEDEKKALTILLSTASQYQKMISVAEAMADAGRTPTEIDAAVRIDDAAAIESLKELDSHLLKLYRENAENVRKSVRNLTMLSRFSGAVLVLMLLALAILIIWYVHWRLVRPFGKFIAALEGAGDGDHRTIRLPIDGQIRDSEIGVFAAAFNRMTELLQSTTVSRDYVDNILGSITEGIVTVDANGRIKSCNSAIENLFGYREEDLIGRNVSLLLHQDGDDAFDGETFESELHHWTGLPREVIAQRMDSFLFPVDLVVTTMTAERETGYVISLRDITERKKADKAKSEFVSTVSHELRTPLTSIKGALGLVRSGAFGKFPHKLTSMLDIAYGNADRLVLLINDILDMEKVDAGMMSIQKSPMEVVSLVDEAIKANRGFGDEHGVTFVRTGVDTQTMVDGDKTRLMQVLTNLMSNAAKFSPEGEQVELSISYNGGAIRIAVNDNGLGIPEEFRERVFQKFSQADSSDTRQIGGTGLGLSITKAIVELHGGTIGFETVMGKGSTFFIDLPRLV